MIFETEKNGLRTIMAQYEDELEDIRPLRSRQDHSG